MSFLYAPTTSDCRPLPMMSSLSDPFRRLPEPDHFRLHPSLVLRYFRFPFDYPSPPIRMLLEQWGPNRLPMLLQYLKRQLEKKTKRKETKSPKSARRSLFLIYVSYTYSNAIRFLSGADGLKRNPQQFENAERFL